MSRMWTFRKCKYDIILMLWSFRAAYGDVCRREATTIGYHGCCIMSIQVTYAPLPEGHAERISLLTRVGYWWTFALTLLFYDIQPLPFGSD